MTYLDDDNTFNYYAQQRGEPWKIQFSVNLNLQSTSSSDYNQLPASVRKEIHNMSGSAFAVQQLLFEGQKCFDLVVMQMNSNIHNSSQICLLTTTIPVWRTELDFLWRLGDYE